MVEFAIRRQTPIKLERRALSTFNLVGDQPQNSSVNRRIVLSSRPDGAPTSENFQMEELRVPTISARLVLLRTLYLSLDPYLRGRMNDSPAHTQPVALGEVMSGGTVARVEASQHPDYHKGDLVLSYNGWQDYAVSDGQGLIKLDPQIPHPSLALGVLGIPGFAAYMGLLDIGTPQVGETLVVAAASGAVGSAVGQIGKLKGCRVVGIAGGAEKCRYVIQELGFDACIDHHSDDFPAQLAASCLHGIDIYFESVDGAILDAVLPLLNVHARIPLCGMIANYNDSETNETESQERFKALTSTLLYKRIKMQGFIIFDDYGARFGEFFKQMSEWVNSGKIKYREDIVDGLQNAPETFIGLFAGKNFGKSIVRLADN
ncbi:MAG: NADP-dependent oxidoreductase [Pseudomonadota bacterium]